MNKWWVGKKNGWEQDSFRCPTCGKYVRGLVNLVRGIRLDHECLKGCIYVWDERSEGS